MSFRVRLTLVAAAAVALAVVVAAPVVYLVVREELRNQVDDALQERAEEIAHFPLRAITAGGRSFLEPRPELGGASGYVQVVQADGRMLRPPGEDVALPVNEATRAVARGEKGTFAADTHVSGTHVRVLTASLGPGFAVQVARPLTEVDDALDRIQTLLIVIAAAGVAVAAGLGLLVSRAALAPVRRLTEATERVTKTRDLSQRIDAHGRDELSRLAASFNTMLAALEDSTRAQRQLVADASHELRTPLTSLRTNIEVLASERELPVDERRRLLGDVIDQLGEMTTLIAELVELARGDLPTAAAEDVRLDLVTAEAVERTRRNQPGITFKTDLSESLVHGVPRT